MSSLQRNGSEFVRPGIQSPFLYKFLFYLAWKVSFSISNVIPSKDHRLPLHSSPEQGKCSRSQLGIIVNVEICFYLSPANFINYFVKQSKSVNFWNYWIIYRKLDF